MTPEQLDEIEKMKAHLSTRIRPNSEAAPWVIEEVRKLEAEVERLRDIVEVNDERLATLNDEKNKEVERLRDLIDTVIRNCMECYDKRECQSCAWLREGTEKKR